jgi:hypothetical protein
LAFTSKLLNLSDDAAPRVGLAVRLAYCVAVGSDRSVFVYTKPSVAAAIV